MRMPNGYGAVIKLSGKRRRPYQARITVGYSDIGKQLYATLGYFAKREEALCCLEEYHSSPYDIKAEKTTFVKRRISVAVSTPPSHGGDSGSSPGFATDKRLSTVKYRLSLCCKLTLLLGDSDSPCRILILPFGY